MLVQERCTAVAAAVSKERGLITFDQKEGSFKSEDFLSFIQGLVKDT